MYEANVLEGQTDHVAPMVPIITAAIDIIITMTNIIIVATPRVITLPLLSSLTNVQLVGQMKNKKKVHIEVEVTHPNLAHKEVGPIHGQKAKKKVNHIRRYAADDLLLGRTGEV